MSYSENNKPITVFKWKFEKKWEVVLLNSQPSTIICNPAEKSDWQTITQQYGN